MSATASQFQAYIREQQLFAATDQLFLAVSGGLDSTVLTELCTKIGNPIHLLHVNFQLRGEESERDQEFVEALAARLNVPVSIRRADTMLYATEHKCSVQEAARAIRYAWFEEMRKTFSGGNAWIVTAHHLDDNIETSLKNFITGTGIRGLRGMLPRQGKIVRPLLWATRLELEEFARQAGLQWVEDSSNESEKYTRNFIRHRVLPLLEQVHPQARANLAQNVQRFRETEILYLQSIDRYRQSLFEYKGNEIHMAVGKLKKLEPLRSIVFELTNQFGFSASQADEIIHLLDADSGRQVSSATHRLIRHRNWLVLTEISAEWVDRVVIDQPGSWQFKTGKLVISRKDRLPSQWPDSANSCWIAESKVHFPLQGRRWQMGDYFYPFGMGKKKKLSRFFIDQKMSATAKEKQLVLEMNGKICWLPGLRSDDRFRVTGHEKSWLQFEWFPA